MSTQQRSKVLNTREAAVYLELIGTPFTAGTLEVWRSEGRGPRYRKVGRRVFYAADDLDRFAAGQVVETIHSVESKR